MAAVRGDRRGGEDDFGFADAFKLAEGDIHRLGELLIGGFVAVAPEEFFGDDAELVDLIGHADREPDSAGLVGGGASDGLVDPVGCIGGEFEAAAVVEHFDGAEEADVGFLCQVGSG